MLLSDNEDKRSMRNPANPSSAESARRKPRSKFSATCVRPVTEEYPRKSVESVSSAVYCDTLETDGPRITLIRRIHTDFIPILIASTCQHNAWTDKSGLAIEVTDSYQNAPAVAESYSVRPRL